MGINKNFPEKEVLGRAGKEHGRSKEKACMLKPGVGGWVGRAGEGTVKKLGTVYSSRNS